MRKEIVQAVSEYCKIHNLDYRQTWRCIYDFYGKQYAIWPQIHYKFGHKSKLDFLEAYEPLYKTITKMRELLIQLGVDTLK